MILKEPIPTERFLLKTLDDSYVSERYVGWLNDSETMASLEARFTQASSETLKSFVVSQVESPNSYLLAITVAETGEHIGNIKLGPINAHHKNGSIGLLIGEKNWWGKGVATEVIAALSRWAFETLGLAKLTAGAYSSNVGSIRAFEACGFLREGTLQSQVENANNVREDVVLLGLVNPNA